jgi:hypothetical protein
LVSTGLSSTSEQLDLCVADADVRIRAPQAVLDVVEGMLAHVSHSWTHSSEALSIEARFDLDVWRVGGVAPKGRKTLGSASALPQVAGAIVSSLIAELTYHKRASAWRAAVVERNGGALAMVGDDWESIVTLVAHLHTRGWRILGGDYAIVERGKFVAIPFRKMLHANSFCVTSFPLWYRRAVEASPWYSTGASIEFYAIDPTLVGGTPSWGERTPIRALLRADGHAAEHPSIETGENFRVADGVRRSDLIDAGIESGMLVRGGFIETCDFLERWFASA